MKGSKANSTEKSHKLGQFSIAKQLHCPKLNQKTHKQIQCSIASICSSKPITHSHQDSSSQQSCG